MRVLVTGGNGDLGSRLLPRLLAAGHQVSVGSRSPRWRADAATEVPFHLDDPASVRAAVEDVEVVVHLASDPRQPDGDVAGMSELVAAAEAAGVAHLLYLSIVGIDQHGFPYYRAKLACEQVLAGSSVPWTVLRTTQFHGLAGRFADGLGRGAFGVAPTGLRIQPLDPEVVAERIAELVEAGPSGRVADLGGPEVLELGDAMRRSLRAAGRRRLLVPVRLPAKLGGDSFRRGEQLLSPDGVVAGGRTFAEYLADEVETQPRPQEGAGALATWLRVVGWVFIATAAWLVVAPQGFVDALAGFGEAADHFLRDLGTFMAPLGIALVLSATRPRWRRPVLGLALLQNGLHLLNHLVDIGTTEPAWHGPVNAAALAGLQVVLVVLFRAAGRAPEPGAPATTGAGSVRVAAEPATADGATQRATTAEGAVEQATSTDGGTR